MHSYRECNESWNAKDAVEDAKDAMETITPMVRMLQ